MPKCIETPSEMKVAPRYKLLTLLDCLHCLRRSARSSLHFSPKKTEFQSGPTVVKKRYTVDTQCYVGHLYGPYLRHLLFDITDLS